MIRFLALLIASTAILLAQPSPGGPASGDLCGSYPTPTVCGINGATLPISAIALATNGSGQIVSAGTTGTGNSVFQTNPSIPTIYGGTATGSDLTLQGTSNGSPTNANVFINPNGQFTQIGTNASTPLAGLVFSMNAGATAITPPGPTPESVFQIIGKDGDSPYFDLDAFGQPARFTLRSALNTMTSPSATTNSTIIGSYSFQGYQSSFSTGASVIATATQNWSSGNEGTELILQSIPNGSATQTQGMIIQGGVVTLPNIGSSTAADTGSLCWNSTAGTVTYNPSSTCLVSSLRFKHGIRPLFSGLNIIQELRPVNFYYNETGASHIGLIAEDVAKVNTSLVAYDKSGLPAGVETLDLVSVLIRAVQEQQIEINQLKKQIKTIQRRVR